MRKIFLGSAVFGAVLSAKAAFFLGASGETRTSSNDADRAAGIGVSALLGGEFFAGDYAGLRLTVGGGYEGFDSSKKVEKNLKKKFETFSFKNPSGNGYSALLATDFIINFYANKTSSFGIFLGAQGDFAAYNLKQNSTEKNTQNTAHRIKLATAQTRAGFTFMHKKHRVDLFVTAPFYQYKISQTTKGAAATKTSQKVLFDQEQVVISYAFVF